ncbi:uncharacterized protein [Amphiura filiformis]|uniref:uncharacterized protein isoform X2 n=1 Tax=Amphiura filiformis TaxID=82378 RepID=UPI003B22449F
MHTKDMAGQTAFHLANASGQYTVCEILLKAGADVLDDEGVSLMEAQSEELQSLNSKLDEVELDQSQDRGDTPAEILARGPKAVEAYLKASKDGTKRVYRTRLMLVGQERVGKTSLMKSFTGQRFNESEQITDGVDSRTFVEVSEDKVSPWKVQEAAIKDFAKYKETQEEDAICDFIVQKLKEEPEIDQNEEHERDQKEEHERDQKEEPERDQKEEPERDQKLEQSASLRSGKDNIIHGGATETSGGTPNLPEAISKKVAQQLQSQQDDHKGVPEFHIWDFGGHDVYYTTHQVFLSHRAIYVLVFDLRLDLSQPVKVKVPNTEEDESRFHDLTGLDFLDFWMQSIFAYTTTNQEVRDENKPQLSPPIFIVGTHRESDDISTDPQERKRLISEKFKSIYNLLSNKAYEAHVVSQHYDVENSSNSQADAVLSSLRKDIISVAGQETYMGEKIPLKWLKFEKRVAKAIKEGIHFMELEKVQDMSKELAIEEDTLFAMLKFYHDLGTIIYFGGDDNTNRDVQQMVILDPQWLIDIFKKIITVLPIHDQWPTKKTQWRKLKEEGIIEDSLIDHMWHDLLPQKKALVAIMEMFDLLCPQLAGNEGEGAYYVPACLQPSSSKMPIDLTRNENGICTFYIDFEGFLPDGLFHRLLVHAARWSQDVSGINPTLHYRYGNFCYDKLHNFQLTMQTTNPCVKVTVGKIPALGDTESDASPDAKACGSVKTFLVNALNKLTKTWIRRITCKFSIACPCNDVHAPSEVSRCYHLLPLEDCLKEEQILCNKTQQLVNTEFCRMWFQGLETKHNEPTKQEDQASSSTQLLPATPTTNVAGNQIHVTGDLNQFLGPVTIQSSCQSDQGSSQYVSANGRSDANWPSTASSSMCSIDGNSRCVMVTVSYDQKPSGTEEACKAVLALHNGQQSGNVKLINCTRGEIKESFDNKLYDQMLDQKYGLTQSDSDFTIRGACLCKTRQINICPGNKGLINYCAHARKKVDKSVLEVTKTDELCKIASDGRKKELPNDVPHCFQEEDTLGLEGLCREFKKYKDGDNLTKRILDEMRPYVSAFANTNGGRCFIGVYDNNKGVGIIHGQEIQCIAKDAFMYQEFVRRLEGKMKEMIWLQRGRKLARDEILKGQHWDVELYQVQPPAGMSDGQSKPNMNRKTSMESGANKKQQSVANSKPQKEAKMSAEASCEDHSHNVDAVNMLIEQMDIQASESDATFSSACNASSPAPNCSLQLDSMEETGRGDPDVHHNGNAAAGDATSKCGDQHLSKKGKKKQGCRQNNHPSGARPKQLPTTSTNAEAKGTDVNEKVLIIITVPRLVEGVVFTHLPECPIYVGDGNTRMMTETEWMEMWLPILFPKYH